MFSGAFIRACRICSCSMNRFPFSMHFMHIEWRMKDFLFACLNLWKWFWSFTFQCYVSLLSSLKFFWQKRVVLRHCWLASCSSFSQDTIRSRLIKRFTVTLLFPLMSPTFYGEFYTAFSSHFLISRLYELFALVIMSFNNLRKISSFRISYDLIILLTCNRNK